MSKIWISREVQATGSLKNEPTVGLEYPQLVRRFLASRELLNAIDIEKIFSMKTSDLADPFSILGMSVAVQRLIKAFIQKEKVCIYADFDLDGASGLAVLYQGLKSLKFENLVYYQPKRLSEGYGFHRSAVLDLQEKGVSLIITVDVGITAFEACSAAKSLGVDVIVTDHHQSASTLPEALVIINPNQKSDHSGLGYLCGAGVAYYFLRALNREMIKQNLIEEKTLDLKSLLDFFIIGTLTDLVPLVKDNRILVKHGLIVLQNTQRPGLKALLKALKLNGRDLSAQDVAIRFAPKLNALSRMENGILPVDLFLQEDSSRALDMVDKVLSNNEDRVTLQSHGEKLAQSLLADWVHPDFIFVSSKEFHRGVVGLIATRLAQNFNRPAFVGSSSDDGLIVGSARVPNSGGQSVLFALESATDLLNRHGGHHSAAGFELLQENELSVIQCIKTHFETFKRNNSPIQFHFDLEVNSEDLSSGLMKWLDAMGPFGQGFPVPLFLIPKQKITQKIQLRGGHFKFTLESDGGSSQEALLFSPSEFLNIPNKGDSIDILGELQWNYFGGVKKIQLLIRDLRDSEGVK